MGPVYWCGSKHEEKFMREEREGRVLPGVLSMERSRRWEYDYGKSDKKGTE